VAILLLVRVFVSVMLDTMVVILIHASPVRPISIAQGVLLKFNAQLVLLVLVELALSPLLHVPV